MVWTVLCGVHVIRLSETQYEYFETESIAITLPEAVYLPLVCGSVDRTPMPPV